MIWECLIRRKIAKKKIFFFEKLQVSNAKNKGIFFQKKSLSQMIPKCLIRQEMEKNSLKDVNRKMDTSNKFSKHYI